MAGVANASAPGQGARNSRNEVAEDDDVQPERPRRCLADRDGAVQLFVRQHSSRNDKVLPDDWDGGESAERSAVARSNSKYRTTAFTSRSS